MSLSLFPMKMSEKKVSFSGSFIESEPLILPGLQTAVTLLSALLLLLAGGVFGRRIQKADNLEEKKRSVKSETNNAVETEE